MATIKELLQERVESLRELTERISSELEGDADLDKLSSLGDELAASSDSFAASIMKAQESLTGGDEGGDEQREQDDEESEDEDGGQ